MPNKLTSLTGFGEGDPKPEKKGAKAKALSAKMGKPEKHYDHKKYGSVMKGRTAEQLAAYKRDSV